MVSHEFRTPLGVIVSSSDILRRYFDRLDPVMRQDQLDIILRSTGALSGLVEDLLLLGKVEAGKLQFQPEPIDLATLCRHLADEVLSATRHSSPLNLQIDGNLAGATGDEGLLRPALLNLLTNAVKYSPPGVPVEFRVTRAGHQVRFEVRDRGIGIPDSDKPRLFAAFSRGSNVGDRPGTGLGLVIAKKCVELHGGAIEFSSQPGDGTTFSVTLPLFASGHRTTADSIPSTP
jgi:signal transduction histidine kinase